MRGQPHSEELRAQVMAALLAGQSVGEVAKAYQLHKSVVSRWKGELPAGELQQVATKKADEFGDLLSGYLREVLTTLSVQAEFARDKAWLAKQPASEVAVLHGVLTDKAIRLLEASEHASEEDDSPAG